MWDPSSLTQDKLNDYRQAAEAAWGEDTRHEAYLGHPQPSAGQCYVTSRWLSSHLGGHVGSKDGHYFWVSPDKSHVVDLTGDQFAYEPAHPAVEGLQLDQDDEPWEFDAKQKTYRPGPVMFKRADHPLYKGFRVKSFKTESPRVQAFAARANAALEGRLEKKAYQGWGGDAYPGQEPQVTERLEHDNPGGEDEHYKWVYANGQLELSPEDDYNALADFTGIHRGDRRPVALGDVDIRGGRAYWKISGNLGLSGIARVLAHHTRQAGWEWGGLEGLGGQKLSYTMWMAWSDETGHLFMSHERKSVEDMPLTKVGRVDVFGATATVDKDFYDYASEGLDEWAEDHRLALNTLMKPVEDIDGYDTYGPRPEYEHGPTDITPPSGTLRCPECGQLFPSFGQYILHRKEEESRGENLDEVEDGHFPQMDMDKALKPHFHEREPFTFPLAKTARKLDAHMDRLWDDTLTHYGAYLNGNLVGMASINSVGNIEAVTAIRAPEKVFASLVNKLKHRHEVLTYAGEDSLTIQRLQRMGFVMQSTGPFIKWAAGKEPMDMINDPVPFVYDVDKDQLHVGQPGANTHALVGQFTPGGIVEGMYNPGGVITITNQTDYPWTVRHLVDLWYWSYPHMRVTDVKRQLPDGNTQKLAQNANTFYHVAPRAARESILQSGLIPGFASGFTQAGDWANDVYSEHLGVDQNPVYLSRQPSGSTHVPYGSDSDMFDTWAVDTSGMHLHPDLPGLVDAGGVIEPDHGVYFEGDHPFSKYLDDMETVPFGTLLADEVAPHAIGFTGSAAHLGPIEPSRLKLYNPRVSRTSSDVGPYVRNLAAMDPAVWKAYQSLKGAGGEVYAVGGVVRDALMGVPSNDIDLMVTGLHQDAVDQILKKLPGKVDLTGKSFGVFRYNYKGHEVEIALPRTERSTGDRRVDFDVNIDHTLPVEDDLQRRDFTGNSIAVALDSGRLVDPFGGAQDIQNGILRTTHPNSFKEDPTRTLRALVMHGRYGWNPDERTREELRQNAHRLHLESWDNMNGIVDKLFKSKNPAAALRLAHDTGVLPHFLPELESSWDYDSRNPHHAYPLGTHHMHVLEGVQEQTTDPDLRMAAALHDIGKPSTRMMKCNACGKYFPESGPTGFDCPHCGSTDTKGTFHGNGDLSMDHAWVGANMAADRLTHMRLPVSRRNRIVDLIRHHMFPAFSSPKGARKFLNTVGDHADDLLTFRHADMYGKGTDEAQNSKTPVENMRGLVEQARQGGEPTALSSLAVNGRDIMGLGIKPGPQVGQILNGLMQAVIENPELNTREQLLALAEKSVNGVRPEQSGSVGGASDLRPL